MLFFPESKHDADLLLRHSWYSGRDCDQDRLDGSAWLHTSRAGDGFATKCACNTDDLKHGKCENVLWIFGPAEKADAKGFNRQVWQTDQNRCLGMLQGHQFCAERGLEFAP